MINFFKGLWVLIKLLKNNPNVIKELIEAHNAVVDFINSNFKKDEKIENKEGVQIETKDAK